MLRAVRVPPSLARALVRGRDLAVYAVFLAVELLARSLPPQAVPHLAAAAGTLWWACDGRRRGRVRQNLRAAFHDALSPAEQRRRTRGAFAAMLQVPLEVFIQPRLLRTPRDLARRTRIQGDEAALRQDWARGRGGLIVTGHLGNWELAGRLLTLHGLPARAVMRPVENPYVDARVRRARGGDGHVIGKRGAVKSVIDTLREGRWVALLADQNAGRGGVFVPFFGLPASTHPLPAVLALRLGLPLYAGAALRRPGRPFTFDVHLRRMDPGEGEEITDARVDALMAQVTATLEEWVRLDPGQYNWLHRRWKSRPPGESGNPWVPAYAVPYGAPGWAGSGGFRRRARSQQAPAAAGEPDAGA